MGVIKGVVRSFAERVASRVARHDLFEKEGERTRAPVEPVGSSNVRVAGLSELVDAIGPGKGIRIVNHWATWCSGCVEELPELVRLESSVGDRVSFIGISWERFQPSGSSEEAIQRIRSVMEEHDLCWQTLVLNDDVDPEEFFARLEMACRTIPQTWVIDADGRISKRIDGALNSDSTDELIAHVGSLE